MFVCGQKEIDRIHRFASGKGAMMVCGLRRVGKTALIKQALEDGGRKYIYFEYQKTDEELSEFIGKNDIRIEEEDEIVLVRFKVKDERLRES